MPAKGKKKKSSPGPKPMPEPNRFSNMSGSSPNDFADPLDDDDDNDSIEEEFDQYQIDKHNFQHDYEPLRLGLKPEKLLIVLEFETPSNGKKFQHYINV